MLLFIYSFILFSLNVSEYLVYFFPFIFLLSHLFFYLKNYKTLHPTSSHPSCVSLSCPMLPPRSVADAFEQTAVALQQFGVERIRVAGLSSGCGSSAIAGDGLRTLTEQEFMREFVFHLRPCIIVDALNEWGAMKKWREDTYLFNLDGHLPPEAVQVAEELPGASCREKRVTVALTPNGRADAVTEVRYNLRDAEPCSTGDEEEEEMLVSEKVFLSAAEVKLPLPAFYALLQANAINTETCPMSIDMRAYKSDNWRGTVAYGQLQNNCFNTEYTHLHADVHPNVEEFGVRVFGGKPEACNVWLGTSESVSSLHQDWVENLYSVIRGVKEFVLIPPWEGAFIPKPEIPSASFAISEERSDEASLDFKFEPFPLKDGEVMPWMDFDVTPDFVENEGREEVLAALNERIRICHEEQEKKLPEGRRDILPPRYATTLHPLTAHVHPGETLYLPAMWLHRVSQRPDPLDVNTRAHQRGSAASSSSSANPLQLPLIAAVNYWFDMSFDNPAVVMLREFGILL